MESIKMAEYKDLEALFNNQNFDTSDFGKESLGILPESYERESIFSSREPFGIEKIKNHDLEALFNTQITNTSDFGKESLGILPESFGRESVFSCRDSLGFLNLESIGNQDLETVFGCQNLNTTDIGKESLGLLPESYGRESMFSCRESLGILNLSSFDIGRESLPLFCLTTSGRESITRKLNNLSVLNFSDLSRESSNLGKESLGVAQNLPDAKLLCEDKSDDKSAGNASNLLNVAFLHTISRGLPVSSSSCSDATFNSNSLEGPSFIAQTSARKRSVISGNGSSFGALNVSSVNSAFNNARLLDTADFESSKPLMNSPNTLDFRARIQSLPVPLEENAGHSIPEADFMTVKNDRRYWSAEKVLKNKPFIRRSFHEALDFAEIEENGEFTDSVFIEAKHLADKIADNSIYDDNNDDLDSFNLEWPEDLPENTSDEKIKPNTETIFKKIDKMIGPPVEIKIKSKNSKTVNCSSCSSASSENGNSHNKSTKNISKINQDSDSDSNKLAVIQNLSKVSQTSETDPLRLLKNLSDILHEDAHLSNSQKSEGQYAIESLATILTEKRKFDEDSGHSSIDEPFEYPKRQPRNDEGDSKGNTDDMKKLSKSCQNQELDPPSCRPNMSASLIESKPVSIPSIKVTSSFLSKSLNKTNTSHASTTSNDSNPTTSRLSMKSSVASKLKTTSTMSKKGPLKALIPMDNMAKKPEPSIKVSKTPQKTEKKPNSGLNSKRTSTPIHDPKLKPIAASTPSNDTQKLNTAHQVSPLARPKQPSFPGTTPRRSIPKPIVNKSFSNVEVKPVRRNSVSDIKSKGKDSLKRSNSIGASGKPTGLMSALNQVRQNITSSPFYKGGNRYESTKTGLSENQMPKTSLPTPGYTARKQKKTGKENKQQ